jgi:hypothetical protein
MRHRAALQHTAMQHIAMQHDMLRCNNSQLGHGAMHNRNI